MSNLERALAISSKHQFSEYKTEARAIHEAEATLGSKTISACQNHLDDEFMGLLKKGAHLEFIQSQLS